MSLAFASAVRRYSDVERVDKSCKRKSAGRVGNRRVWGRVWSTEFGNALMISERVMSISVVGRTLVAWNKSVASAVDGGGTLHVRSSADMGGMKRSMVGFCSREVPS